MSDRTGVSGAEADAIRVLEAAQARARTNDPSGKVWVQALSLVENTSPLAFKDMIRSALLEWTTGAGEKTGVCFGAAVSLSALLIQAEHTYTQAAGIEAPQATATPSPAAHVPEAHNVRRPPRVPDSAGRETGFVDASGDIAEIVNEAREAVVARGGLQDIPAPEHPGDGGAGSLAMAEAGDGVAAVEAIASKALELAEFTSGLAAMARAEAEGATPGTRGAA